MRSALLAILIGVVVGVASGLSLGQVQETAATPVSIRVAAPVTDHLPTWLGFFPSYISSRYPLYYCLEGDGWTQQDHDTAKDVIENAWGWAKANRTVLTQMQERCNEPPRVSVHFTLTGLCDPAVAYACVTFHDWTWHDEGRFWTFDEAWVWVNPEHHARATNASKATMFSHEFGHTLGLADQEPARYPCGYTLMDYVWEVSCGIPPYPTYRDILEVDAIGGPYKDPAWYRCTITDDCLVDP
jgi:hypothetical protein